MSNRKTYIIDKTIKPVEINAEQNKPVWQSIKPIDINETNNWEMSYHPKTKAKMCYDESNLYIQFIVKDKYVISTEQNVNGEVWKDSCVELFISPIYENALPYFNLEINAGGTPLMSLQKVPRKEIVYLDESEIKKIKIAHSLPKIITQEIKLSIEWYLELALPFSLLEKYLNFTKVKNGTKWRANFYKCAEKNSHPHWLSWNKIKSTQPDFHKPEDFGIILFN